MPIPNQYDAAPPADPDAVPPTGEVTTAQDTSKAAAAAGFGFGLGYGVPGLPGASGAGGVITGYGAAVGMSNFGYGYGSLYTLPIAAIHGTGVMEGTNKYASPMLAGPAGYGMLPGYSRPWPGTYATYRLMAAHPTIALATAAIVLDTLTCPWSVEADDGAPKEIRQFIEKYLIPQRHRIVFECLRSIIFGWRGFEKVFEVDDGYLLLKRLKPLLPELTNIRIDESGRLAGLEQEGDILPLEKTFVYTYDRDADNHYGRCRLENCRRTWSNWLEDEDNLSRLGKRTSSIIAIVKYPPGTGTDANGNRVSNYSQGVAIANGMSSGRPVVMENLAGMDLDDLKNAPDLAKQSLWDVGRLDMGNSGPAQEAMVRQLEYRDKLLVRGMLIPERTILEAVKSGSRADSEEQGNLGLSDAECLATDIAETFTEGVLGPLLQYNFGRKARRMARIVAGKLTDANRVVTSAILRGVLSNPAALAQLIEHTDMAVWQARAGIPANENRKAWDGELLIPTPGEQSGSPPNPNGKGNKGELMSRLERWMGSGGDES